MLQNLPNVITLIRIVLAPVIAIILWQPQTAYLGVIALALFCFAGFSDWLDGWLARRLNIVSSVGRMLDPIADKLLIAACLMAFAAQRGADALFLIPALIIIFREFLVSGLREYLAGENSSGIPGRKMENRHSDDRTWGTDSCTSLSAIYLAG